MDNTIQEKLMELIQLLKDSTAYFEYSTAKQELAGDANAQNLLNAYKLSASALQRASLSGQEPAEADRLLFASMSEQVFAQEETAKLVSNELILKSNVAEIIQQLSKELHLDY